MFNKPMKISLTSLVIIEMKTKTTTSYYIIPIRRVKKTHTQTNKQKLAPNVDVTAEQLECF